MATLQLHSLVCDEPATANGDDIDILINGLSVLGQFSMDQGQSQDLREFSFDFNGRVFVEFKEDSDLPPT